MTTKRTAHAMPVEIWSDIACPWCYVGKRRFEAARDRCKVRTEASVGTFFKDCGVKRQEPRGMWLVSASPCRASVAKRRADPARS